MRKASISLFTSIMFCLFGLAAHSEMSPPINMAVEFTDHAASAYVAMDKKMYAAAGLNVKAYKSYATGMALAGALTKGHINVAYMCLIPAISAYANGGVPIRVVSGTHLYGYGLVVDPDKIKTVKELEMSGIRIGCMQAGSTVDVLLHRCLEKFNLHEDQVWSQTRRMSPEKAILAIRAQRLDAAFLPEHWASMGERYGFTMLVGAKDIWPDMIGSVLVVRRDLIRKAPVAVQKLVQATKDATDWMNEHPVEKVQITARYLSFENDKARLKDTLGNKEELEIGLQFLARSMARLEYTVSINKRMVQETIDYMARLGYIKKSFMADDILDLEFLK